MRGVRAWTHVWCVVAAIGLGVSTLEWSPTIALVAVLVLACCAGLAMVVVLTATDRLQPDGRVPWRRLVPQALAGGAGLVTFLVLAGSSPPLALLCVLLCLVTWPPLLLRIRRRPASPSSRARPMHEQPPGTVPSPPDPWSSHPQYSPSQSHAQYSLAELDDDALCRLWRHTYWQLELQATEAGVLDLVALRQACLDELERRAPSAVHAWLSSGARASGGPERFWPHGGEPGSADAA